MVKTGSYCSLFTIHHSPFTIARMIEPGTVLQNRYAVERQIGEGGMGAVYVATDRRFGSTVALKEAFFQDAALRKAFEREARLLNRLRHHRSEERRGGK